MTVQLAGNGYIVSVTHDVAAWGNDEMSGNGSHMVAAITRTLAT